MEKLTEAVANFFGTTVFVVSMAPVHFGVVAVASFLLGAWIF